jgi:hypothetical protein
VVAAAGQEFSPVKSPTSSHPATTERGRAEVKGREERGAVPGSVPSSDLALEAQPGGLRTTSMPTGASPPTQLRHASYSTDIRHQPLGRRCPHHTRPPPQIHELSTARVKQQKPRHRRPRRARELSGDCL